MRRNTGAFVLLVAAWTLPPRWESSASGQDLASRFDDTRLAIEQGRYADAEVLAQSLVRMAEPQTSSADSLAARDLLVQALVCNGRGQDPETQALAEEVVKERRS